MPATKDVDDFEAPRGLAAISTEKPEGESAVPDRVMRGIIVTGVVVLGIVGYSIYRRNHVTQEVQIEHANSTAANGPATSKRKEQQGSESTTPSRPFRTVTDVLPGDSNANNETHTDGTHPDLTYKRDGEAGSNTAPVVTEAVAPAISAEEQERIDIKKKMLDEEMAARKAPIGRSEVAESRTPAQSQTPSTAGEDPKLLDSSSGGSLPPTDPALAVSTGGDGLEGYKQALQKLLDSATGERHETQRVAAQTRRRDFQKSTGSDEDDDHVLHTQRQDPPSRFMLMRDTPISASVDPLIISELPGEVTAVVRRPVYDSWSGQYILIPAGSRLIGEYNSEITPGQNRLQIAFTSIVFPDTTSRNIGRGAAYSADGASGVHDKADHHIKAIIGSVAVTSLIQAGIAVSNNRSSSSLLQYPSTGSVIGASVGQQAGQLGSQLTQNQLTRPATLKIRPGAIIEVKIVQDIAFDAPYEPHHR